VAYTASPASAAGDDAKLCTDSARGKVLEQFHFLRQQSNREGSEPCRSLADFIAPKETGLSDHIGAFAVTSGIGLKEFC
jgi:5-methyltetrahydrofolate--homocysteine methyltransferase